MTTLSKRDDLVLQSMPLVRRVALHMVQKLPAQVELDDLVQAGFVGLLDAASRFDHTKGVRFWTYAELRIRGSILDSLRGLDWLPRSVRRRRRELDAAASRLEARLGRAPDERELARELGVSVDALRKIRSEVHRAEASAEMVEGLDRVAFLLRDPNAADPQELLERRQLKALLAASIETLTEREQLVLSLYYHEELTMREVGEVLGVNESRISQIHGKAVRRLRLKLQSQLRGGALLARIA